MKKKPKFETRETRDQLNESLIKFLDSYSEFMSLIVEIGTAAKSLFTKVIEAEAKKQNERQNNSTFPNA